MALTLIAAGSLSFLGLAELLDYVIGADGVPGDYTTLGLIVLTCRLTGLVGVIWLAWCGGKLARGVASVAEHLERCNSHDQEDIPQCGLVRLGDLVNSVTAAAASRLAQSTQAASLEQQIRDLQVQVHLSARQKKHVEAVIYSIRDAVIVLDESGKLLMANEAAGKLFDFDHGNSQHKPLAELIDAANSAFIELVSRSGQTGGRAKRSQIEFLQADKLKTFDCIVSRVHDEARQVCGVVAVLHDITREKEISQMKSDFVSHVSHELKTPLASLTAYSEMLCEGEADDEKTRKEFYSVIQDQARRLNRLIEDILNISRIESGLIKVDKKPVSLTVLIEEQLRMIKSYAEEKNIEVTGQKPIVRDQVYVDADMISQVIVNLLSNAVKYTPSGGSVRIESQVDETAGTICVKVTDTGVGIPQDEIEHVFDKFYRVSSNKAQAKGTGLGLNLVKQIVEKVHNGRVFVSSKPGAGSTFGFELSLATAPVLTPSR
jgi:two-component system phosphate regulon sensor histidine kinase PhoR